MELEEVKVGLGITTYRRPDYLARAVSSIEEHLQGQLHAKLIHDDATPAYDDTYIDQLSRYEELGWFVHRSEENVGVAASKNRLLYLMMMAECDVLILMEDDCMVISPEVIRRYYEAMRDTGLHHLMFAHHGPANAGAKPVLTQGPVEGWANCVGQWCVYTAYAINGVGYLDENFGNELDHVNHSYRLVMAGIAGQWGAWPDVKGSKMLLVEQPGAIASSVLRHDDIFQVDSPFQRSLHRWYNTYPMPAELMRLLR